MVGLRQLAMDRERGESGEFATTVTPERVLAVFETAERSVVGFDDLVVRH